MHIQSIQDSAAQGAKNIFLYALFGLGKESERKENK